MPDFNEMALQIMHLCWCCFQMGAGQEYNQHMNESQRDSLQNLLDNAGCYSPEEMHESWMKFKLAQGWTYGPVKDFEKQTHPDLVPWAVLPEVEQRKDNIMGMVLYTVCAMFGIERIPRS